MTTDTGTQQGQSFLGGRRRQVRCKQCRQVFTATRSDARTCSDKCRQRLHRLVTATAKCDEYGAMTPTELAALEAVPDEMAGDDAYPWWDCGEVLH